MHINILSGSIAKSKYKEAEEADYNCSFIPS